MSTKGWPTLKPPAFLKELRKQGLTVEQTSDGVKVTHDDGRYFAFHLSSLQADPRTYHNIITQLNNAVGPILSPHERKMAVLQQKREARRGHYACDQEGCEFVSEWPNGLGAHKRNHHGIAGEHATRGRLREHAEAKAAANGRPAASSVRVRHQEPADPKVKAKRLVATIRNHAEALDMATTQLLEMYEIERDARLAAEAKLKKLSERLAGAVDVL